MERRLHEQIEQLRYRLLEMAARVEDNIARSVRALADRDLDALETVIERDDDVDLMELEVDEACISLLALYQPAGRDLRLVATALKIVKDLERVGDIAKSVARHGRRLAQERPIPCPPGLVDMAGVARGLLRRALDAFVNQDVGLAREVIRDDDEVDSFHRENVRRLIQMMVDDPSSIGPLTQYLSVNKLLERIGDHSSNIAAMVVYMVEGRDIRHLKKQQAAGRL